MERIIKNVVYHTATKRKIHILESLSESNTIIPSSLLADQLQCTNRTIRNDIAKIKQNLPAGWDLKSITSRGYTLDKKPEEKLSSIIAPYLLNSEIHIILEGIFNHNYYTLEKWSQLLYMDKLTLKQILNKFRDTLRLFGLDFKFRTLQLVGDELHIRFFYSMYFYAMGKYKKTIPLHSCFVNKLEHIVSFHGIELDFDMLIILIQIFINRNMKKYYYNPKNNNTNIAFSENTTNFTNCILSEIEKLYNLKLPENEQRFLKNSLFLILEGDFQDKKNIMNFYRDSNTQLYDSYISILNEISNIINLEETVTEKIQFDLFFELHKIYTLKAFNFPTNYLLSEYKELNKGYPELMVIYNSISPLITKYNKVSSQNKLNEDEIHYITFNILSNINFSAQINTLLLLSGTSSLKKFIYNKLDSSLGNSLLFHTHFNNNINYDFIITNRNITNNQIPVIQISNKVTLKDINNIKKYFYSN
ncbi:helix-turn-helix domain-containing protein [Bacillus thuringiensis]|nr:helix-turn-helix domain-containing protein [Bacillus thuringiensis]